MPQVQCTHPEERRMRSHDMSVVLLHFMYRNHADTYLGSRCRHEFCWICSADYNPIFDEGNHRHEDSCTHYRALLTVQEREAQDRALRDLLGELEDDNEEDTNGPTPAPAVQVPDPPVRVVSRTLANRPTSAERRTRREARIAARRAARRLARTSGNT
jgi:hypothetical protein